MNYINLDVNQIDMGLMNMSTYGASQVRASGIDSSHVDDLVASIEAFGQKDPIQVEKKIVTSPGGPTHDLSNGGHRLNALIKINKRRAAKGLPPMQVKAEVVPRFTNPNLRILQQVQWNEVDPAKNNEVEDLVGAFQTVIQNGHLGNLAPLDDKQVLKKIKKFVVSELPNRKNPDTIAKKVFNTLGNHQKKIKSYTSDGAIAVWDKQHQELDTSTGKRITFGGSGVKNGRAVYLCDSTAHLGNTIGLGMLQCTEKGVSKYIVVAWLKGIGKSEKDVIKFREDMIDKVDSLNANFTCQHTESGNIVDELYFLPQIVVSGEYETEESIIRATLMKKDTND